MMFCFGGFRYNEWAVGTRAYAHKRKAQNMTYMYHAFSIQYNKFYNFSFLTLPQIYSPYTPPSETILTNKAIIERQQAIKIVFTF